MSFLKFICTLIFIPNLMACATRGRAEIPWRPGEVNPATGKMIVVRTIPGEDPAVEVTEGGLYAPYSMICLWEDNERFFYVFDNEKNVYFGTRRIDRFLAALESLPKHSKIEKITSCQVSWAREMPPGRNQKIEDVLRKREFITEEEGSEFFRLVCRCGSNGVQLPPVEKESVPVVHPPVPWSDRF